MNKKNTKHKKKESPDTGISEDQFKSNAVKLPEHDKSRATPRKGKTTLSQKVPKIVVQGHFLEIQDYQGNRGNSTPPTRGKCGVFSESARRRMKKLVATLGDAMPIFVTLTYGSEWSRDWEDWKRDLDVFLKRLKRYDPNLSAIWKLEPQKRHAPHFHLLIYGGRVDKDWLALNWAEATGDVSEEHIKAGTRVESLKSFNGVLSYTAKYMAKDIEENLPEYWLNVGQWWGVYNRKLLPKDKTIVIKITDSIAGFISKHFREKFFWARVKKLRSLYIKQGVDPELVDQKALENVEPLSKYCYPLSSIVNSLSEFVEDFQQWAFSYLASDAFHKSKEGASINLIKHQRHMTLYDKILDHFSMLDKWEKFA